jgi:pimeloyl-ACP methyl ester carboxylesterase
MRYKKILLYFPLFLAVVYLLGPAPHSPNYCQRLPTIPAAPTELDAFVQAKEQLHQLKPDNQARIVWHRDSVRQATEYALVYLHGFSASQYEGAPVHREIAQYLGANLYLSRLEGHGIDTSDPLANLTAEAYWNSATEALAIGKQLGKKVILMGTSTGATQALQLASVFPDQVAGLILYSPNIAINDPNAWLLNNPWGLPIAKWVTGGPYRQAGDDRPVYQQYWYGKYRLEGTVALEEMLESTMTAETFKRVNQPVLMLYYFRDEAHQDPVVKVSAMLDMFNELGTEPAKKRSVAMPLTGDHVIASPLKSGDVTGVIRETKSFLRDIMKLPEMVSSTK